MKTIIFDMFGVIAIDPAANLMPFVKASLPHYSDDEIEEMWIEAARGEISSCEFFRRLGFSSDIEKHEREYLDTVEVDESFFEVAEKLRTDGFKLALLSNDISEWSAYVRDKFGLDKYFDVIVVSGDCGLIKPDARIFKHVLERLSEKAENCVFIDDRVKNLEAARSLGMDAILFCRNGKEFNGKTARNFIDLYSILSD